jgi:hypothetical protein
MVRAFVRLTSALIVITDVDRVTVSAGTAYTLQCATLCASRNCVGNIQSPVRLYDLFTIEFAIGDYPDDKFPLVLVAVLHKGLAFIHIEVLVRQSGQAYCVSQ